MKLFCFGLGFSATALAARLAGRDGVTIAGTRTRASTTDGPIQLAAYQGDAPNAAVTALLQGTTHVLISIPPAPEGCAALRHFGADLAALTSLRWVGYLSTIGVYGDHGGAWVDEDTPVNPRSERAVRRWQAEQAWGDFGRETGKSVQVFRLPGIYGPGRSVFDTLKAGTAKRLIKPGQVFNRIHVADIAQTLDAAMMLERIRILRNRNVAPDSSLVAFSSTNREATSSDNALVTPHALFNVIDDEPCAPEDVVTFGADLLGIAPPPATPFDASRLSPMAASFYSESKRVRNTRLKSALGITLLHPTYREGLRAIHAGS